MAIADRLASATGRLGEVFDHRLVEEGLLQWGHRDAFHAGVCLQFDVVRTKFQTLNENPTTGTVDLGEIAAGKRADLVQVKVVDGIPVVRRVWVRGQRVA